MENRFSEMEDHIFDRQNKIFIDDKRHNTCDNYINKAGGMQKHHN